VADENDPSDPQSPPEEGAAPEPADQDESRAAAPAAPQAEPENRRARRAARSTSRKKGNRDRPAPRPGGETGLDASERVDDAVSRATDRSFRWLKEHFNDVQWLIVAGAAVWIGSQIYSWRSDKTSAKVSDALAEAVNADLGRSGGTEDDPEARSIDTRRSFATDEEQMTAAKAAYEKVVADKPSAVGLAIAQLGLAGVLYDQGKYDDAAKLYEQAAASELAKQDPESKARSIEGLGLTLEAKGDRDGALKRFGELENIDVAGFRELALYHQGRLLHAKGDDDGAKERLKKVVEKLGKEKESTALDSHGYLLESARSLLERIDPKAVPPPSSDEALKRAIEQFQKKLPGGVTPMPMPLPENP
jgi:tetratricopeptide (TPR) repeat protein